ncbi:MAG: DciA family protein [Hyphomonadaceae bacterium]|nr:DciA family protein [Hyphomonadaceae bacterium]
MLARWAMTVDWDKWEREREAEQRLAQTRAVPVYRPARPMGAAVARALRPLLKEAGPAPETLQSRWTEIVGMRIAAITEPVRVSRAKGGNVLHLRVPSAAAPIIQHATDHILERVNLASGSKITSLKLVQTAPPKQLALVIPRPLTPEQRAELVKRLAPVQSNALRSALSHLGEAVMTGTRKG